MTKIHSGVIDDLLHDLVPLDARPVHLYFTRPEDIPALNATPELMNKINDMARRVVMCTSWAELPAYIRDYPETICFNYSELKHSSAIEIVNMVRTLSKLVDVPHEIRVAVDIGKDTPYPTIKMLQKSGIYGIIPRPCDFGFEECYRGSAALWAGIPYWPKHIISELPGYRRKISVHASTILTPRQQQILDLVRERGLSNKSIARTLNITESTVKLHMGKLFQKFGVKSRTQLVAFNRGKSKEEV